MLAIKALFTVAVYLVKGLTNRHAAFFQLNLYQWQAIDQHGHIVTIRLCASLFKLLDHLQFVVGNIYFVQQVDILNMSVIEDKVVDIVIMNFACFIDDGIAGFI